MLIAVREIFLFDSPFFQYDFEELVTFRSIFLAMDSIENLLYLVLVCLALIHQLILF